MTPELSKRLKKITPKEGGVDLSFNQSSSPQGKFGSSLILKILEKTEKGLMISSSIQIGAISDSLEEANVKALDSALTLLGD